MSEIAAQVEDGAPIESGAVDAPSLRFRPSLIGYFRRRKFWAATVGRRQ